MVCSTAHYCIILLVLLYTGCRLEYLPPYSPDYQPIEQAFSVIKSHLHQNGQSAYSSRSMYHEMYAACNAVTPEMTWGFFSHSGYLWFIRHNIYIDFWRDKSSTEWVQHVKAGKQSEIRKRAQSITQDSKLFISTSQRSSASLIAAIWEVEIKPSVLRSSSLSMRSRCGPSTSISCSFLYVESDISYRRQNSSRGSFGGSFDWILAAEDAECRPGCKIRSADSESFSKAFEVHYNLSWCSSRSSSVALFFDQDGEQKAKQYRWCSCWIWRQRHQISASEEEYHGWCPAPCLARKAGSQGIATVWMLQGSLTMAALQARRCSNVSLTCVAWGPVMKQCALLQRLSSQMYFPCSIWMTSSCSSSSGEGSCYYCTSVGDQAYNVVHAPSLFSSSGGHCCCQYLEQHPCLATFRWDMRPSKRMHDSLGPTLSPWLLPLASPSPSPVSSWSYSPAHFQVRYLADECWEQSRIL